MVLINARKIMKSLVSKYQLILSSRAVFHEAWPCVEFAFVRSGNSSDRLLNKIHVNLKVPGNDLTSLQFYAPDTKYFANSLQFHNISLDVFVRCKNKNTSLIKVLFYRNSSKGKECQDQICRTNKCEIRF